MGGDFEDAINLDQMTDADVRELVRQRLGESEELEADTLDVDVVDGRVRIEGRVGTDGERQHVEQVLGSLGALDYENNIVVDPVTRIERPEAADRARLEDAATTSELGDTADTTSDTADHLRPHPDREARGTRDMGEAIQEGRSYNPPEGPFQEGVGEGEQH